MYGCSLEAKHIQFAFEDPQILQGLIQQNDQSVQGSQHCLHYFTCNPETLLSFKDYYVFGSFSAPLHVYKLNTFGNTLQ